QANPCGAVEAGEGGMREVAVDVAQRGPVWRGMAAVDVPGDLLQLAAQGAVFADVGARQRRDLQVGQGALLVRVPLQVAFEAVEALGQALGVVQPVHADRQQPVLQAGAQAAYRGLVDRARRLARYFRGIDADRERAGAEAASTRRLEQIGRASCRVTGVQTCALPISGSVRSRGSARAGPWSSPAGPRRSPAAGPPGWCAGCVPQAC